MALLPRSRMLSTPDTARRLPPRSVRFTAITHPYRRDGGFPPTVANLTVTCWLRLVADRNAFTTFWALENNGTQYLILRTTNTGTLLHVVENTGGGETATSTTYNLPLGLWHFVAVVKEGTALRIYWMSERWQRFRTVAATTLTGMACPSFWVGSNSFTQWLHGNMAALKIWTHPLSVPALYQEMPSRAPRRWADLRAWYPLEDTLGLDYSPNRLHLSAGSTAGPAIDLGPPLLWIPRGHPLWMPREAGPPPAQTATPAPVVVEAVCPAPTLLSLTTLGPTPVPVQVSVPDGHLTPSVILYPTPVGNRVHPGDIGLHQQARNLPAPGQVQIVVAAGRLTSRAVARPAVVTVGGVVGLARSSQALVLQPAPGLVTATGPAGTLSQARRLLAAPLTVHATALAGLLSLRTSLHPVPPQVLTAPAAPQVTATTTLSGLPVTVHAQVLPARAQQASLLHPQPARGTVQLGTPTVTQQAVAQPTPLVVVASIAPPHLVPRVVLSGQALTVTSRSAVPRLAQSLALGPTAISVQVTVGALRVGHVVRLFPASTPVHSTVLAPTVQTTSPSSTLTPGPVIVQGHIQTPTARQGDTITPAPLRVQVFPGACTVVPQVAVARPDSLHGRVHVLTPRLASQNSMAPPTVRLVVQMSPGAVHPGPHTLRPHATQVLNTPGSARVTLGLALRPPPLLVRATPAATPSVRATVALAGLPVLVQATCPAPQIQQQAVVRPDTVGLVARVAPSLPSVRVSLRPGVVQVPVGLGLPRITPVVIPGVLCVVGGVAVPQLGYQAPPPTIVRRHRPVSLMLQSSQQPLVVVGSTHLPPLVRQVQQTAPTITTTTIRRR